jgi:biopolymer transport protein ExbB
MSAKNFGATSVGLVVGFLAFSGAALAQESATPTAPAMPAAPAITPPAADLNTAAPQVQATVEAVEAVAAGDAPANDAAATETAVTETAADVTAAEGTAEGTVAEGAASEAAADGTEGEVAADATATAEVTDAAEAPEAEPATPTQVQAVFDGLRSTLPESLHESSYQAQDATEAASKFLRDGGPSIWAIAALSVVTLALILWKVWRLLLLGAWSRGSAHKAVAAWEAGDAQRALSIVAKRRGLRSRVVAAAIRARMDLPEAAAREETTRVAKLQLAGAGTGLRALELIASIAPLLGLLGTVLGMIAAFQALQESGSRADPSLLAGGIWEALLTTAAGMAVAIPASAALTWFEAVVDGLRRDVEDAASRIFLVQPRYEADEEDVQPLAAE